MNCAAFKENHQLSLKMMTNLPRRVSLCCSLAMEVETSVEDMKHIMLNLQARSDTSRV